MLSLKFDFSDFERRAKELDGVIDQIPFALAGALNEAATNARQVLTQSTWPSHVSVRNAAYIRAALRIERANKRNLTVAISDTGPAGGRGNLQLHAKGGTKTSKGRLALPDFKVKGKRTSRGVPKQLRPAALPNSFRKGDVIYQRTGAYAKGNDTRHLKLMYTLKPSASIKEDVPFEDDFITAMRHGVRTSFPAALARAMKSRRR